MDDHLRNIRRQREGPHHIMMVCARAFEQNKLPLLLLLRDNFAAEHARTQDRGQEHHHKNSASEIQRGVNARCLGSVARLSQISSWARRPMDVVVEH